MALCLLLAACGTTRPTAAPAEAGTYKVGDPYEVGGNWYYPQEDPSYDQTGIASYYGNELRGARTANGERFDPGALTGAHKTLPMPSNVRVTNIANGKSIIVRINDRGPFKAGRLIDVSAHAAELLGFKAQGMARVRVQFVGIADLLDGKSSKRVAGNGREAGLGRETPPVVASAEPPPPAPKVESKPPSAAKVPAPETAPPPAKVAQAEPIPVPRPSPLDEPNGVVLKLPVHNGDRVYVQAGSFAGRDNAERLQSRLKKIADFRISPTTKDGKTLYRVRSGPYKTVGEADSILDLVLMDGQKGADIVVE